MRRCLMLIVLLAVGCAKSRPAAVVSPVVDVKPQLAAADALLLVGCVDCLEEALRSYNAIRVLPNLPAADAEAALVGSVRAAILLDLRQRELGMADQGHLERARGAIAGRDDLNAAFAPLIDDVAMTSWRFSRLDLGPVNLELRRRFQQLQKDATTAIEERRQSAGATIVSAYDWVAFVCTFGNQASREPAALSAPIERWIDTPIIRYRVATCGSVQRTRLTELVAREPRFHEINYWLGLLSISAVRMEDAEAFLLKAYEWRENWPAVTAMLANVYVTAEELAQALTFYERTLALVPDYAEAQIGRVRALSLLGRHDAAVAAIDEILNAPDRAFIGDAYYWRAWNGVETGQLDQAWTDVEQSARLWVNSEVAKLSGIIAYRRGDLPVALKRFTEARRLNADDCDTQNYLGVIHAEQREWLPTVETFTATVACLENARAATKKEIDRIAASETREDRKSRQIATRTARIDTANRMISAAWFNMAASYFNLGRREEARPFAERLVNDERFGERARDLLSRLP